jgi:glycosyltransferase 2 family protein
VIGIVVAVLGFGFVIQRAIANWDDVQAAMRDASRVWLVPAFLLAAAGMTVIALAWRHVLAALGGRVSVRDAVRWYFPGELGKYVPGGIWPVVGRAELARRGGVRRGVAYASVALSLGALYLAAIAVVAAALPAQLAATNDSAAPLVVALLLPVGVVALHPRVLTTLHGWAQRVVKRDFEVDIPSWRTSLLLVARYVPAWALIGGATWCVARAFDDHAPFGRVFVAAVVSWVVGFLLVPVPGGVGVREAVFVAVAGLSVGVGATVALIARLIFMAVDTGGAVLAPMVTRTRRSSVPAASAPDPPH